MGPWGGRATPCIPTERPLDMAGDVEAEASFWPVSGRDTDLCLASAGLRWSTASTMQSL